ncbi:MAG: VWA domain-containing protein [Clostridia bacterium]|nr:VWA domain-containing protein [Clostridia bacterium]
MKKSTIIFIVIAVVILIVASLSLGVLLFNQARSTTSGLASMSSYSSLDSISSTGKYGMYSSYSPSKSNYMGFSVGGAKDIENFRENIKNKYFPISTDITYNGLFYDYMFDTGVDNSKRTGNENIFFPSYSTAISKDPFSDKQEYYMTVGLNSNIKEEDFQRKKLNLLVLLDISGSMGSPFYSYYYDNPLEYNNNGEEYSNESKMKLANKAVCTIIDQLNQDDKFGLVTFDTNASTEQKIEQISKLNISKLKEKIMRINDKGSTNFSAGYIKATSEFADFQYDNKDEYENRIIIITDAMPNYGDFDEDSLMGLVKNNATSGIYTTFIGVGVDFNTKLIETITDVKGANYYSVHNSKEFAERVDEGFEYMVTPLVFDLSLDVKSDDFNVTAIYGSDSASVKTGNIMKVNTLFPSKSEDGEVKGGVILLKLSPKNGNNGKIDVSVSYADRNGKKFSDTQSVTFKNTSDDYYDNSGIRKAIVLTRYANTLKDWILYERSADKKFLILPVSGIIDGYEFDEDYVLVVLGQHERASVALKVSDEYKEIFKKLKEYIEKENEVLNDDTFKQEYDALDLLINFEPSDSQDDDEDDYTSIFDYGIMY